MWREKNKNQDSSRGRLPRRGGARFVGGGPSGLRAADLDRTVRPTLLVGRGLPAGSLLQAIGILRQPQRVRTVGGTAGFRSS